MRVYSQDHYLRLAQVCEITGLSRSSIYNYVAAGLFPKQRQMGIRAVRWLASEVHTWMEDRAHAV
ncbi:TPA: AlpA family transcriptional regulator [Stenotrophomonas maltophilia]|uniref:helix-turn-helix transcriptional regulator n=1 Tax=Stenotrophomonas maltophilia TaxID=40324 RepID=UPI0018D4B057|nr:AlpA family transcriptional regulator [Stenotrophomonas maltophilia]MBH1753215.1 AlpA family transcriptional regulator [Stenotrophomonas maltophilia]MBH1811281.1 AlpA family transcriptional regulator [Stenotrophomonas maltophilia]MBS6053629.1 AlpA family transcriptional regulator [Stenotrophomonas maltophilia]HEL4406216.1 AlpA family transcriptional regulator [Stenotrophomonas maltophilia]HEL4810852.1 AlpA family transcriptional regulator [Stenotrophomonas maltophilia]